MPHSHSIISLKISCSPMTRMELKRKEDNKASLQDLFPFRSYGICQANFGTQSQQPIGPCAVECSTSNKPAHSTHILYLQRRRMFLLHTGYHPSLRDETKTSHPKARARLPRCSLLDLKLRVCTEGPAFLFDPWCDCRAGESTSQALT